MAGVRSFTGRTHTATFKLDPSRQLRNIGAAVDFRKAYKTRELEHSECSNPWPGVPSSIRNAQTYGRGCLRAFGMLKPMAGGAFEHSECSNPCSAIVGEHSECSNLCSAIVGEHSECSNPCSAIVGEHSECSNPCLAIVGEHSECFCSLVYKAFASAHPRDRARTSAGTGPAVLLSERQRSRSREARHCAESRGDSRRCVASCWASSLRSVGVQPRGATFR